MPTNRRKRRYGRREVFAGMTDEIERTLMHGRAFIQQPSLDVLKAAWREHGDEIKAKWKAEHPPGTRPFGAWLFDLIPRFGERKVTRAWLPDHEKYRANHEKYNILDTHYWPPCQEPEHRYLFRNGEISVGEFNAAEAVSTFDADMQKYDEIMADKKPLPPDTPDPFQAGDISTSDQETVLWL